MIAVLSDSHIGRKAEAIPGEFLEIVEESEVTVHCGDFETRKVHDMLESRSSEFIAVMGNCDRFQIEDYRSFEYRGIEFGVTHGKGINPRGDHPTLARIAEQMNVNVLFHGHTHIQEAARHEDRLLLNPGSCTGAPGGSYSGGKPEMMTVDSDSGKLKVRKLELDGKIETETLKFDI